MIRSFNKCFSNKLKSHLMVGNCSLISIAFLSIITFLHTSLLVNKTSSSIILSDEKSKSIVSVVVYSSVIVQGRRIQVFILNFCKKIPATSNDKFGMYRVRVNLKWCVWWGGFSKVWIITRSVFVYRWEQTRCY